MTQIKVPEESTALALRPFGSGIPPVTPGFAKEEHTTSGHASIQDPHANREDKDLQQRYLIVQHLQILAEK